MKRLRPIIAARFAMLGGSVVDYRRIWELYPRLGHIVCVAHACGNAVHGEPLVNLFSGATNVLKNKKGASNYTHLVPTLY